MNYEQLRFIPVINGVTVIGNKRFEDYGIVPMTTSDINEIFLEIFGYTL